MRLYLFGLAEAAGTSSLAEALSAVQTSRDLSDARVLCLGSLAGITSDVLVDEIRPNRRNLLAHMRILEAAQQATDLLPVQFGQVFSSEKALAGVIAPNAPSIRSEIMRLSGKAEVAVRISAERDQVISSLAAHHPELQTLYRKISAKGAAGHFELIELGRQVGDRLARWREAAKDQVLAALEPVSTAAYLDPPSNDTEVVRADFLLERSELEFFEAALADALPSIPHVEVDDLTVRIVGPAPPSRFVTPNLLQGGAASLGSAA